MKHCCSWSGFWTEAVPLPGPPFLSPSMARIFYGGQLCLGSSMVVVRSVARCILRLLDWIWTMSSSSAVTIHHISLNTSSQHYCTTTTNQCTSSTCHLQPNIFIWVPGAKKIFNLIVRLAIISVLLGVSHWKIAS